MIGRSRRGFTLVEVVVAAFLVAGLLGAAWGLFHLLFSSAGRHNATAMAHRSSTQKDIKVGIRRLTYRLRESIQILSPAPGTSAPELEFRDITNSEVRVRHQPGPPGRSGKVVSERKRGGQWELETQPVKVAAGSGEVPVAWPVDIPGCAGVTFTVLSPDCVTVQASVTSEGFVDGLLTVIKLRNVSRGW